MQARTTYEKATEKNERLAFDLIQLEQTINAHLSLINNLKDVHHEVDNTPPMNFSHCKSKVVVLLKKCKISFVEEILNRDSALFLLRQCIIHFSKQEDTFQKVKENKVKEQTKLLETIQKFKTNAPLLQNLLLDYQKEYSEIDNNITYLNSKFNAHQVFITELSKQKDAEVKYISEKLKHTQNLLASAEEGASTNPTRTYIDAKLANETKDLLALMYRNYTHILKGFENEIQKMGDVLAASKVSHLNRIDRLNKKKAELSDKISKISRLLQEVPSELLQSRPEQQTQSATPLSSQKNEMTNEENLDVEFNDFMRSLLENPTEDLGLPSVPLTLFNAPKDNVDDEQNEPQNTKRQKTK